MNERNGPNWASMGLAQEALVAHLASGGQLGGVARFDDVGPVTLGQLHLVQ